MFLRLANIAMYRQAQKVLIFQCFLRLFWFGDMRGDTCLCVTDASQRTYCGGRLSVLRGDRVRIGAQRD